MAGKFHRDGAVTTWQKAGRGEWRGHGLNLLVGRCSDLARFEAKWNSAWRKISLSSQ
jgi:hypothetical protein